MLKSPLFFEFLKDAFIEAPTRCSSITVGTWGITLYGWFTFTWEEWV